MSTPTYTQRTERTVVDDRTYFLYAVNEAVVRTPFDRLTKEVQLGLLRAALEDLSFSDLAELGVQPLASKRADEAHAVRAVVAPCVWIVLVGGAVDSVWLDESDAVSQAAALAGSRIVALSVGARP